MNKNRLKLVIMVLTIIFFNAKSLLSIEYVATVPFFEDDKYLETVITYSDAPNTDLFLHEIDCISSEELISMKEIFVKNAVAELIRRSVFYHGMGAYIPYQQKIYVPSCFSHFSENLDTGQFYVGNYPNSYKEYPWINHFSSCDSTKWDLLQLTLQLVDGKVVILSNSRFPQICFNVPPTCTPSNNLLNTYTTNLPDWTINPPYSTTTPFGMPANSHFVKENTLQTYNEGTNTIYYINMYEEYAMPNDLTWRAVVRKPLIREDSDSLSNIDPRGLFGNMIKTIIHDILGREMVEPGNHTVELEFPDLQIGDDHIDYGIPTSGGKMTFDFRKSDNGLLLISGNDNCNLSWIPNFGNGEYDIKIGSYFENQRN
jgi:hypothetical protein